MLPAANAKPTDMHLPTPWARTNWYTVTLYMYSGPVQGHAPATPVGAHVGLRVTGAGRATRLHVVLRASVQLAAPERQREHERGPLAQRARHAEAPAVRVHQRLDQRQAEARAAVLLGRRVIRRRPRRKNLLHAVRLLLKRVLLCCEAVRTQVYSKDRSINFSM